MADTGSSITYPRENLDVASGEFLPPRWHCYVAHQAAELALKPLLIANDVPPPRVRNVSYLSRVTGFADASIDLVPLDFWARRARYPGFDAAAGPADAASMCEAATAVLASVDGRAAGEGAAL